MSDDAVIACSTQRPASKYKHVRTEPENPFFSLINDQSVAVIPEYTLESGVTMYEVPVAYKTYGTLNEEANNVMLICHALTGSADVEDWWGPLIGPGRAFDTTRFYIVCLNSLGSPYGSASPVTLDPRTGHRYGPEFPLTTVRDDVGIHKLILDDLGVKQIAIVIGGSMGGMLALEWAFFGTEYVKSVVALATSARHSAWCISWGEAQRQSIYSDPKYDDGYYSLSDPPAAGLAAARMSALLTYRSRNSFESRFGRNVPDPSRHPYLKDNFQKPSTPQEEHWAVHNEGFLNGKGPRPPSPPHSPGNNTPVRRDSDPYRPVRKPCPTYFSAQSYLRYQGNKFVKRFDPNCYIAITRKLDTHDVSRGRTDVLGDALQQIKQPVLVIGIESDGLFTIEEQEELAKFIPHSRLERIDSPEGHDAFLLQFAEVNRHIVSFLKEVQPDIMNRIIDGVSPGETTIGAAKGGTTGEVDDITSW